jgi:phosphate transport system substrate-binding protein
VTSPRSAVLAGILATLIALVTACAAPAAAPASGTLGGRYIVSTGTGALAVATALTKAYSTKHPAVTFTFDDPGSTAIGTQQVADGTAALAFSSRDLAPDEQHGLAIVAVGLSGTAVIVNPANPVRGLSKDQLKAIFSGSVTDWSVVGGTAGPIHVVARDVGKATRLAFDDYVFGGAGHYTPAAAIVPDIDTMVRAVAADRGAIGMATLDARTAGETSIRPIAVDGVAATKENLANGTYRIRRPLLLIFNDRSAAPAIRDFVDFVRGPEGQAITSTF